MALQIKYSERPKMLNGYPVIGARVHENVVTVMVKRGDNDYVVATWWPELKTTWQWGHYFHGNTARVDAQTAFSAACDRNAKR